MNDLTALKQAMLEYADAIRGDWNDFDGRSEKAIILDWVSALNGGDRATWTIEQWRADLNLCPDGEGHWGGRWGYCAMLRCPTWTEEHPDE